MKLRKCIECTHLADPLHVWLEYGKDPHYHQPPIKGWQTWHFKDYKHGDGPHYFYTDRGLKSFWKKLKKRIFIDAN